MARYSPQRSQAAEIGAGPGGDSTIIDTQRWAAQLDELQDGIAAMRRFFEGRDTERALTALEMLALERLFDRYLDADQAFADLVERLLKRDAKRPHR